MSRPASLAIDEPGISPASPIAVPSARPADMSTEDLASFVAEAFSKIKTALPYIIELRERFAALPRGKANVMGCNTWTQFCNKVLHRTDSAVRKALSEEYVTKVEKELEKKHQREFDAQQAREKREWKEYLAEEKRKYDALPNEEKDRLRQEAERRKQQEEQRVRDFDFSMQHLLGDELPDRLKPTASEIVEAGYRQLAKRRHPDLGGSQDGMALLNETVACLRRIIQ